MRKEGIVIEGTWMINECGLTKVVQVRRLRKLRLLSMGFPARSPHTYTPRTRDDRFSNESRISGKIARTWPHDAGIFLVWLVGQSRRNFDQRLFGTGKSIAKSST
jgi:hypothetical protein